MLISRAGKEGRDAEKVYSFASLGELRERERKMYVVRAKLCFAKFQLVIRGRMLFCYYLNGQEVENLRL